MTKKFQILRNVPTFFQNFPKFLTFDAKESGKFNCFQSTSLDEDYSLYSAEGLVIFRSDHFGLERVQDPIYYFILEGQRV